MYLTGMDREGGGDVCISIGVSCGNIQRFLGGGFNYG